MVDFIRLYWDNKQMFESFVENANNFSELNAKLEMHSGNFTYPYTSIFYGLEVRITEKHGYVKNSLHKAFNIQQGNGDQNYNDFGYSNLCSMINRVKRKFSKTGNYKLTQFEFGLNIEINVPAEQIITNNVLMHKYKGANHDVSFKGLGKLKQFDYHNHVIKIYDKSKQYKLRKNLLRVEIKFTKTREFESLDIYTLDDLKDKNKLRKLFLHLMKNFEELTIVDDYDEDIIDEIERNKLARYNNPKYWEEISDRFSSQTVMRKRRDYEAILSKYDLLKTKDYLRKKLRKKYVHLINF